MEDLLTNSGSGSGCGDGFGFGSGDGYGSGFGYGSGDGSGFGSGYGDGFGSGDGYGSGFGSGDGYGSGFGYGSGDVVGIIGKHHVKLIKPFGVLLIGCEVKTIDDWKANWRSIAKKNGVKVSMDEVDALLVAISEDSNE